MLQQGGKGLLLAGYWQRKFEFERRIAVIADADAMKLYIRLWLRSVSRRRSAAPSIRIIRHQGADTEAIHSLGFAKFCARN